MSEQTLSAAQQTQQNNRDAEGRYQQKTHSDVDDSAAVLGLDEVRIPDPGLDEALAQHGLSASEFDELQQAWDEHFAPLRDPRPEDTRSATLDVLDVEEFGRMRSGPDLTVNEDHSVDIEVFTRNGGGNRECYCEDEVHDDDCLAEINDEISESPYYVEDYDDDFDPTYATFVFRVPPGDEAQRLIAAEATDAQAQQYDRLCRQRDRMLSGQVPPWHLMADPEHIDETEQRIKGANTSVLGSFSMEQVRKAQSALDGHIEALRTGQPQQQETRRTQIADHRGRPVRLPRTGRFGHGESVHSTDISKAAENYGRTQARWKHYDAAMAEAEALPEDSVLRETLLGERKPEKLRNGEEYTPRSELQREHATASREFTRAEDRRRELMEALTGPRDEAYAVEAAHHRALKERTEAHKQWWATAWNPAHGEVPESPDTYRA